MLPMWLRPARLCSASTSGACGAPLCRSALTTLTIDRRPAEVGLVLTSAISGHPFHEVDVALEEAHVGLLQVLATADEAPVALLLAFDVDDVHRADLELLALDLVLEEQLDRGLDLGLRRVGQHLEHHLVALLAHHRGLLGNHRRHDHFHQSFLVHARASSRCFTAARLIRTFSNRIRLTGSACRASSTMTFGRLREARYRFSSSSCVRMRTWPRPM